MRPPKEKKSDKEQNWIGVIAVAVVIGFFIYFKPPTPVSWFFSTLRGVFQSSASKQPSVESKWIQEQANRAEYEGRNDEAARLREQAVAKEAQAREYEAWKRKNGK